MTTTAIGASRVASERRSGSEFVQSNECAAVRHVRRVVPLRQADRSAHPGAQDLRRALRGRGGGAARHDDKRRLSLEPAALASLRALAASYAEAPPLGNAPRSPAYVRREVELRAAVRALRLAQVRVESAASLEQDMRARDAYEDAERRVLVAAIAWYAALED